MRRPWLCLIVAVVVPAAHASNWAQVAGEKLQNILVPAESLNARWAHATTVLDRGAVIPLDEDEKVPNAVSEIFIFGGDNYDFDVGGGGLLNDIWKTVGVRWRTYENKLQQNRRGDPLPKIVSRLQWTSVSGVTPPAGISYNQWTGCRIEDMGYIPASPCTPALRERATKNQWELSLRWSPRRRHAATTLGSYVYVLGGYARGLEDTPEGWEVVHGGFERRVIWREETLLKNDVWRSRDGATWELVNPGSLINQPQHVLGIGSEAYGCTAQDTRNCTLATQCNVARGACEAQLWSPREAHAVATADDAIYVTGGYISQVTGFCSRRSCRTGYSSAVADVWRSSNGKSWTLLTEDAPWQARGEHALVVLEGGLFLYGGQGRDTRLRDVEPYLNDVWFYDPASAEWTELSPSSPWSPRAGLQGAVANNTLFVVAGRLVNGDLTNEVWSSPDGRNWTRDFAPGTTSDSYASAASDISYLQSLDNAELASLYQRGLREVRDLVVLSNQEVLDLRDGPVPRICIHLARAKALVGKCEVEAAWEDGKGAYQVEVERVGRQRPDNDDVNASLIPAEEIRDPCSPEPDPLKETTWIVATEEAVNFGELNLTCRAIYTPRHYGAVAVLGNLLYLIGGMEEGSMPAKDVWYRDAEIPVARIVAAPNDDSAETFFAFRSDDAGVLFEAQLERIEEDGSTTVVFPWTSTTGDMSLDEDTELETGQQVMKVRAVDPAGNVNQRFEEGLNKHSWYYRPDLPWVLIILGSLGFIALLVGAALEIRRRRKKRAMERYAIKRMRRKFKGIKKDAAKKDVDWRKYYEESKADAEGSLEALGGGKGKKKTKKKRKKRSEKEREAKAKKRGGKEGKKKGKKKKKKA